MHPVPPGSQRERLFRMVVDAVGFALGPGSRELRDGTAGS